MGAADEDKNDSVGYIPDVEDPLGLAVTEALRHGPFTLAFRDLITCARMLTLFPGVVLPFWTSNPHDEFYMGGPNLLGMAMLSFASLFEVVLVAATIPLFFIMPSPVCILFFTGGQMLLHVICDTLQGPSKVWSKAPTDPAMIEKYKRNESERWFFLNGCCVTGHNVQQNVDLLAETFGRPIFAIHNRTYGVLGDLFECILQRSFDLFTEETRVCYEYVKAYCADPDVKKVVLIAHSQGCIMASQILDQLYVDLPVGAVAKLEVYTFGNAASHFNNPLRTLDNTRGDIQSKPISNGDTGKQVSVISDVLPERVIKHMEHYCNSGDMVTRWGALFSAKSILQNRFCGHIFINEGATGHMLNQHYLSDMFPTRRRKAGEGHREGTSSEAKHHGVPFLDRTVKLDTATLTHRKSNASHQLAVMRHESSPREHDHSHVAHASLVTEVFHALSQKEHSDNILRLGEGTRLTSKDLSGAEGSRISVVKHRKLKHNDGKTVRQLSRLWRYLDGEDPDRWVIQ